MSNLVIVAIPKEDDFVNRISTEKVPHMTLLFLGDISKIDSLPEIVDFTKHIVGRNLTQFGLEVDYRGILGQDSADVLFFSKEGLSGFDIINNFRSKLLQNNSIHTIYDSIEQFPEWVPHLTLGYPESPANPDTRISATYKQFVQPINFVWFDRIAIWYKDFDGIEIPLPLYDFNLAIKKILSHDGLYDPVKAHEYYIRTRHLKGHGPKNSTYTVNKNGKTYKLTGQQLAEQKAYSAKRVGDIQKRLMELSTKLHELMREAKKKKVSINRKPTQADKRIASKDAKQYRKTHKQQLANKAKVKRATHPVHNDPVAELEGKINQVKNRLKAVIETQRALNLATLNN